MAETKSTSSGSGSEKYISPSCERYTGYTSAEFMENGELLLDIVHPEDAGRFEAHLTREDNGPFTETMEFRIVDRQGRTRWISHTCQPVYEPVPPGSELRLLSGPPSCPSACIRG